MRKNDMNTAIGMALIFLLFIIWSRFFSPEPKPTTDAVQDVADTTLIDQSLPDTQVTTAPIPIQVPDSLTMANANYQRFGAMAPAMTGEAKDFVLENDLMQLTISTKGGHIKKVVLKDHVRTVKDPDTKEKTQVPLVLMDNKQNIFAYNFSMNGASEKINSADLFFTTRVSGNTVTLTAQGSQGASFQQIYGLKDGSYMIDYDVKTTGLASKINGKINLHWENYLNKLEPPSPYGESMYSTAYFKSVGEDSERCSQRKTDSEEASNLKWISHANQFFNSALIAEESFDKATIEAVTLDADHESLRIIRTDITLPAKEVLDMQLYVGPNEFNSLRKLDLGLEDVVPFGRSIFGAINRWIINPLFNFLSKSLGHMGLAILVLTFIVKMAVYPLTFRSLKSQAKMRALKPELDKLKAKHGDDQQAYSAASMKLYGEYSVSPLGGCMPMILQMPIWFALYRFFPGAIQFRQKSFLWSKDLSTYDDVINFSTSIPIIGDHISLFTLLWSISILIYTWYNSKQVDMTAGNPMMKYVQYFMPLMFFFFLNSYAAGLTAYLLFSNTLNIAQTLVTKNFIIDEKKLRAEILKNKDNPKKKKRFGKFQERMQEAMKEQQRIQDQKKNKK